MAAKAAYPLHSLPVGCWDGHVLDADSIGPVVRKGWSALVDAVGDDGKLGWVQPVGGAPDSVYETDSHLYGVGAFLLAASQMLQAG